MPLVNFKTNLPEEKLPENFHSQLTKLLADVMNKPEERISVTVESGKSMARGGSFDPICEVHVAAIGVDSREKTLPVVQKLTQFLTEKTDIPGSRVIISITPLQPYQVGANGQLMG